MKNELPAGIVNPFSEEFIFTWNIWKQYKKEQFRFTYKGCISEQAALLQLVTLSGNQEKKAIDIINQSISNGWRGLFMLKTDTNGGQSHQQLPANGGKLGTSEARIKKASEW